MTGFLNQLAQSQRLQLVATAILSGVTVGMLILGFQALEREERLFRVKQSVADGHDHGDDPSLSLTISRPPRPDAEDGRNLALARRAQAGDYDEELVLEQLARNRVFLTDDGLARLRAAFVVVVGCGGVGGHCAAALARSGVARLRLVDFDQVTLSSLNRHAVATLADVGTPKVQCLQRRLAAVAPWVSFDLRQEKFDADAAEALLGPWEGKDEPDFIVDAIDNIDTKVALLRFCHERGLPVISSMGAGCKSDPTRIVVGDIGNGTYDRLSRSTRRRLKLLGITSGIPAVYSTEQAGEGRAELLPLAEEEFRKGSVGDLGVMANFRVRILPVLGTMPAVFGLTIANHIILSVAGYPTDYVPAKGRDRLYDTCLGFLQGSEERLARSLVPSAPNDVAVGLKLPVGVGDVAFLVEEIFRGHSVVTGVTTRLVLVRWRKPEGASMMQIGEQRSSNVRLRDLACMTKEEAVRHEEEILRGGGTVEDLYGGEVIEKVRLRASVAAEYEKYR